MKEKEILEGNKLIAEYMGYNFATKENWINLFSSRIKTPKYEKGWAAINNGCGGTYIHIDTMKYHSSWDWLMPVVEKIAEYRLVYPKESGWVCDCKIVVYKHILYREVVSFIKWLNKQELKSNPPPPNTMTAKEIIKNHFTCVCHEMYKLRELPDPDCRLCQDGNEIEAMMEEYASLKQGEEKPDISKLDIQKLRSTPTDAQFRKLIHYWLEKGKKESTEKIKHDHYLNMQYYMEYCQMEGYVTPQDWIEKHKHF